MTILQEAEQIFHKNEEIEYANILPAKEAIMFIQGIKYQTGSDYSEQYLNTSVGELKDIHNQQICDEIEDQEYMYGEELEYDQDYRDYIDQEIEALNSR